jgi:hypothetical protein
MNATIAATAPARPPRAGSAVRRAAGSFFRFIRNAIKQYGAPYLNGPLPPL